MKIPFKWVLLAGIVVVLGLLGFQQVAADSHITVTRGISPSSVPAEGGEVTVTINISGYNGIGSVEETLPSGFSYVDGSVMPSDLTPTRDGQKWTFFLIDETSFTYRVMTSASAGPHNFPSGSKLIYGTDKIEVPVGGASRITVGTAPQPPSADPCLATLSGDGAVSGEWSSSCESTTLAGRYARYYSFTLTGGSDVTITLESSTDPYLYLREGAAKSGAVAHENDDIVVGTNTDSRIQETLGAGTYTIEATTYSAGEMGSFTLTVSGLGGGTAPQPPSADPCLATLSGDGAVSGEWSSSCESTTLAGRYARYYSFTLTGGSDVTITLESSTDPYLYLREGAAKSGAVAHENDDIVVGTNTDSRIQETLGAGTYTIEATTYSAGETGSFTLTVSGLGGGTGITVTRGISPSSVPAEGGEVTVTINISGYNGIGSVEETLPSGFSYVDGSVMPSDLTPTRDGQKWTFFLIDETSFTYRVMTSASAGPHNFPSGSKLIYGTDKIEVPVGGASRITVGTAPQPPSADPCLATLSGDGAVSGEWSSSCESTARGSYARYYRFTLDEESTVIITLESSIDPYLYLRAGEAKSGTAAYENDDVVPGTDTNSEIEATLGAGIYTIEATTYGAGEMGSFTLGVGTVTIPGPSDDPCLDALSVDGAVNGAWNSDCESTARDSYARYYRFTLDEESTVTITLESSTDPYLYLREGAAKSGAVAHENDDIVVGTNTDSRIQETLGAGTYTIEATTYSAGETGSFTLTVSGLGGGTGITVTRGISPSSVPAEGGEVTVTINISGYNGIGSVEETLPSGFSYVDGSVMPSDLTPTRDGQKWTFFLIDETSFTYRVMTSASAGPHNFPSGSKLIYGTDKIEVPVGGASRITVGTAP